LKQEYEYRTTKAPPLRQYLAVTTIHKQLQCITLDGPKIGLLADGLNTNSHGMYGF